MIETPATTEPGAATMEPDTATVTEADVRHVAALAHLELTADELPAMVRDLNSILRYVAQLGEVDTTGVEPMAQVADVLGFAPDENGEALRRDRITPSVDRAAVMAEAPETDGRFFKVPRVLER